VGTLFISFCYLILCADQTVMRVVSIVLCLISGAYSGPKFIGFFGPPGMLIFYLLVLCFASVGKLLRRGRENAKKVLGLAYVGG